MDNRFINLNNQTTVDNEAYNRPKKIHCFVPSTVSPVRVVSGKLKIT